MIHYRPQSVKLLHVFTLTREDLFQVLVAARNPRQRVTAHCTCGMLIAMMTRDTGFSPKWAPALDVLNRLVHGRPIDGTDRGWS